MIPPSLLLPIVDCQLPILFSAILLISSVRQHRHHPLVIGFGHEHIDIEVAFPLIRFLRQNVTRMRMATLDLPSGGQAHSLRCTFVRFKFWHLLTSPSLLIHGHIRGRFRFRAAAALMSLWSKNNEHLIPFHSWPRFDFTDVRKILFELLEDARA